MQIYINIYIPSKNQISVMLLHLQCNIVNCRFYDELHKSNYLVLHILLHLCQNKMIVSTEQTKFHISVHILMLLHGQTSLSDEVFLKITYSTLQNFFSSL